MTLRLVSAGLAAAFFAASPAAAGWEYTDWGMTPHEVVAAANGEVWATEHDPDNVLYDYQQLARGQVKYLGITMQVNFYFDPDDKTLRMIDILPTVADCDKALEKAEAAFGKVDPEISPLWLADDLPTMRQDSRIWEDAATGDEIEFFEAKMPEGKTLLCKFLISPDGPPTD
ncbi:hypothetical protein [Parerythrobacter aestuarii]|uniref:hypothetical protein n=1 Tax=Parerythrobacter aestuarii TaxID=3020909 RepID=UPI0024DEE39C|nr:hypothetical protein [Parerythrobacter aestuarii]